MGFWPAKKVQLGFGLEVGLPTSTHLRARATCTSYTTPPQFVEDFKTLTINGHPFRADFGGFPMVISVGGKKHYLRLTPLPHGVCLPAPGQGRAAPSEDRRGRSSRSPGEAVSPRGRPAPSPPRPQPSPPPRQEDQTSQDGTGLGAKDPLNSLISLFPAAPSALTSPGYPSTTPSAAPAPPPLLAPPPVGDVNALLASLLQTGLISGTKPAATNGAIPGLEPAEPAAAAPTVVQSKLLELAGQDAKPPAASGARAAVLPVRLESLPGGGVHPSLRERQQAVVDALYSLGDLQCKTCGQRYSREEMAQYTAHLDWHFRVKRREKDNARKAQSRKWFFEKRDWIVSDELEDGTEELTEEELVAEEELVIPTVAVEADKKENTVCPVCRETFATFYKQVGLGVSSNEKIQGVPLNPP